MILNEIKFKADAAALPERMMPEFLIILLNRLSFRIV